MDREISIQVPAFDSFITEYSANISTTGMFIKSEKPLPPDTKIAFEFKIAEDWKLIRGEATVVWCRYRDEGPDQPAGMGVEFTDLEAQSKRLIGWIIEKHVREGGKPFSLDALRGLTPEALEQSDEPAADAPTTPAAATTAARPTQPPRKPERPVRHRPSPAPAGPVRFRLGPLLFAGLLVTGVLYSLFWLSERGAQSAANPELSSETPLGTEDRGTATAADDTVEVRSSDPTADQVAPPEGARVSREGTAASAPVSPVFLQGARRLVDGWSRAWSAQDVDAYLSYYARGFEPAGGGSRSHWAATRRQRLQVPEFIQISITALEAEPVSESRGRVSFDQGYRSNTYQDSVRKVLELIREDGRWKILEEKSAG